MKNGWSAVHICQRPRYFSHAPGACTPTRVTCNSGGMALWLWTSMFNDRFRSQSPVDWLISRDLACLMIQDSGYFCWMMVWKSDFEGPVWPILQLMQEKCNPLFKTWLQILPTLSAKLAVVDVYFFIVELMVDHCPAFFGLEKRQDVDYYAVVDVCLAAWAKPRCVGIGALYAYHIVSLGSSLVHPWFIPIPSLKILETYFLASESRCWINRTMIFAYDNATHMFITTAAVNRMMILIYTNISWWLQFFLLSSKWDDTPNWWYFASASTTNTSVCYMTRAGSFPMCRDFCSSFCTSWFFQHFRKQRGG